MLTAINPQGRPVSPFYSQGMQAAAPQRKLYISGQVGVDENGAPGKDIAEQAKLAIANMYAVLAEAGMTSSNLAKVTIYLTDESHMQGFMEGAGAALPAPPPATTLLIVKALASPALLIEIEGIAVG